jgi:tetratricopeptide (TPR) repeat protein
MGVFFILILIEMIKIKFASFFKFGLLIYAIIFNIACNSKVENQTVLQPQPYTVFEKDSIVEHVMLSLRKYGINSQKRRDALDSAIAAYPTIANLYQQRAMPLYKQDKDELGKPFLAKAAELDPQRYLDYKGFMECIFSKNYNDAIADFEKYLQMFGEGYVMDHTYYFYIGISYLQLNEFEKAKIYLDKSIAQTEAGGGRDWVHHLDLMYLGIANLELGDCENAIHAFDKSLSKYPSFGDVKYYKANCLYRLGKTEEALKLVKDAEEDILMGNTINEDNVIYEQYPYQVRKDWFAHH